MARMRRPHRRNLPGMARNGQPIAHHCANTAAHVWPLAFWSGWLAGDEQQHPLATANGVVQRVVEHPLRGVECMAVQIHRSVRRHAARAQPPVPPAIQRYTRCRCLGWHARRICRGSRVNRRKFMGLKGRCSWRSRPGIRWQHRAAPRPHGCHNAPPQRRLVSAEAAFRHAHPPPPAGQACQQATRQTRCRAPPYRQRLCAPHRPRPKKCQTGWPL